MKIYDSLKTINFTHSLMNKLNDEQRMRYSNALVALFEKKQISEDGEYDNFKITQKDSEEIYNNLFSV